MPTDLLLFVYGSLMRGFPYHGLLAQAVFVDAVKTESAWSLLDLGRYPGVIEGTQPVEGEVHIVDAGLLARLDRFEGCPELYRRESISLADGRQVFAYLLQPAAWPDEPCVIPSASWRQWTASRPS
jgi:gamma-glutamylcyclotransferase (GGCT)/AIG2-like uncharacterized protein YtfP